MMAYLQRVLESTLHKYLSIFPAIAITGPRQSGKSTLIKHLCKTTHAYVSFDDPSILEFSLLDPKGFMKQYPAPVIYDEIQKSPELFHYIKLEIDENRELRGQFILTGSNQFQIHASITETLAGRIGLLSLLPFQMSEIPSPLRSQYELYGGYPELVAQNYSNVREWHMAYLQNYIERDVRSLSNVENLRDFQRFVFLLASRTAQELNMSTLATEVGVTVRTIQRWISILEASYLIFLLPSFHNNLGKRIVKRPKLYFWDTGLVCSLTGIRSQEVLERGPLSGAIFENMVVADLYKQIHHSHRDQSLFYFRSNLGLEADLIIEDHLENHTMFIEIKRSSTFRNEMIHSLRKILSSLQNNRSGYLIYQGEDAYHLSDQIHVVNAEKTLTDPDGMKPVL